MNENLLNELLQSYKELYNLEMANNDEPVTSIGVEYDRARIPMPTSTSEPEMAIIRIVANGLTLNDLSRVIMPDDDVSQVREELAREMIVSVFSLGAHLFKIRKMKEVLNGSKN